MRRTFLSLGVLLVVSIGCGYAQTIAIVGAKAYLTPDADPVVNATIVVRDGRIAAAGPALSPPAGAHIIDAKGRIVMPGLMDSDSELGLMETGSSDSTDHSVSSGPLSAAFDIEYALNSNSTLLPVARADGLTRAVTLPASSAGPPFAGWGAVLRLSEGTDILDRAKAAMAITVGGMAAPQSGGSRSAQWILIRNALDEARRFESDPSSRQNSGSGEWLLSRINLEALLPVIHGQAPLAITAYRESDIRQAIALQEECKVRVVLLGGDEAWRVADLLASQKIPVVLNPYASDPATFDQLGARLDNAAILARAGVIVSFLAPSVHMSHNAGLAIREGAGIAVANGLPWQHALEALTVNPAKTWGIADHYGTLEPGKDADLVLWDGDPLEPASAPELVLVRGKEVSLKTRQTELEQRYSPKRAKDPWPPAYR